jgi:hypothetical protein
MNHAQNNQRIAWRKQDGWELHIQQEMLWPTLLKLNVMKQTREMSFWFDPSSRLEERTLIVLNQENWETRTWTSYLFPTDSTVETTVAATVKRGFERSTMTTPDPSSGYNGTLFAQPPIPKESPSVYTDKTVNTVGKNDQPICEFLLRFEYLQKGKQPVPIISHHRQLLTSILNHEDQVTIYNKANKPVDQARINSITSIAHLRDLVDINNCTDDNVRHILIMKIRTSFTVNELQTSTGVMHQSKTMEAYIQERFFGIFECDIASLGWFRELHPNHRSYNMIVDHCNGLI